MMFISLLVLLKLLEFWCNGCIQTLCRECAVQEHRNHSILRTHESAQEFKQIMPTIVNDLKCKTESINNVITQVCDIGKKTVDENLSPLHLYHLSY